MQDDDRWFSPNRLGRNKRGVTRKSRRAFARRVKRARERAGLIAKRRAIERRIGPS